MLGSLILYLKGMRRMMFQLSGFYSRGLGLKVVRQAAALGSRTPNAPQGRLY